MVCLRFPSLCTLASRSYKFTNTEVLPDASWEPSPSAESELSRLLSLMHGAMRDEFSHSTRVEHFQRIIAQRAQQKSLFSSQFAILALQESEAAKLESALKKALEMHKSAQDNVARLNRDIAHELSRMSRASTPKLPDFEARFQAMEELIEKSVAESRSEDLARIEDLQKTNQGLEARIKALEEQFHESEKQRIDLNIKMDAIDQTVTRSQDMHQIKREVDDCQNLVKILEEKISTLSVRNDNVSSQVEKQLEVTSAQISEMKFKLDLCSTTVSALEAVVDSHTQNLSEIDIRGLEHAIGLATQVRTDEMCSLKKLPQKVSEISERVSVLAGHQEKVNSTVDGMQKPLWDVRSFCDKIPVFIGSKIDHVTLEMETLNARITAQEASNDQARPPTAAAQPGPPTVPVDISCAFEQLKELQSKVERYEANISMLTSRPEIEEVRRRIDEVKAQVDKMQKWMESNDMQIASLDDRWKKLNTKELANRIVGYVERTNPTSRQIHEIQQGFQNLLSRFLQLEQSLQLQKIGHQGNH